MALTTAVSILYILDCVNVASASRRFRESNIRGRARYKLDAEHAVIHKREEEARLKRVKQSGTRGSRRSAGESAETRPRNVAYVEKPSDVSFFRLFDPPPDEPGDDQEKFASIDAPWRISADDDVIEPEDTARQDEDAHREWKANTLQILLSEVYPSAVTIYEMQKLQNVKR